MWTGRHYHNGIAWTVAAIAQACLAGEGKVTSPSPEGTQQSAHSCLLQGLRQRILPVVEIGQCVDKNHLFGALVRTYWPGTRLITSCSVACVPSSQYD